LCHCGSVVGAIEMPFGVVVLMVPRTRVLDGSRFFPHKGTILGSAYEVMVTNGEFVA